MFLKKRFRLFPAVILLVTGASLAWSASQVLGPDHPRNLKLLETAPLLFEYHRFLL